jgi:HK97 family phage major capsid protein
MSVETKKDIVLDLGEGKELNLSEAIKEANAEAVKEMGLPTDEKGRFNPSAINVKGPEEKRAERLDVAANFIKQIILPQHEYKNYGVKAIDTGSGSFGTVVPVELRDEIIAQSANWQVIRRYAFVFQLAGKITVPQEGTAVTAYWVAENAAVTESTPTLTGVTLEDHGVACLVKVSWKLLRTSSENIVKFVAALAGKAITIKEESAFVDGDGSSKPLGINQTSGITAIAQAGGSFAFTDLMALYFALPAPYRANAQFLTSAKGARLLYSLLDADGRPVLTIPENGEMRVLGRPLLESADIAENLGAGTNETTIYFGDFSNYWIKDGSDIEVATQDQIENLQTKIVVYKYVDGKVVNKSAFRKLTAVK